MKGEENLCTPQMSPVLQTVTFTSKRHLLSVLCDMIPVFGGCEKVSRARIALQTEGSRDLAHQTEKQ